MISYAARPPGVLFLLVAVTALLHAADRLPAINANDNRSPGGELKDGVLTIHFEMGEGQWHPESDDGGAFTVYAFGEAGRPLQNPGPLIRVPQGTVIHAIVHNALSSATAVHGLHERPGNNNDVVRFEPGATREVRFAAGAAGTYYYWGFDDR